jgi:hypothetical protein
MILAYNKRTKSEITFANINLFNLTCEVDKDWVLKEKDYKPKIDFEEITVREIKPDESNTTVYTGNEVYIIESSINLKDYSVKTFRENLENFTKEDLKLFVAKDTRATIIKEAKKQLEKITAE